MSSAVLLIHSEKPLREAARAALESAGYAVQEADEISSVWRLVETARPNLIIFPWTSLKLVRAFLLRLREDPATRRSRVIVWALRAEIGEAVSALECGADDCLAVPFDRAELVARVSACLRRPEATARADIFASGPIVLDKAIHCLCVNEREINVAPREFMLIAFFLENPERVFSRDELLRGAWPRDISAKNKTVDVHVQRLRRRLQPFGCDDFIRTVRRFGYRFSPPTGDALSPRRSDRAAPSCGRCQTET